MLGNDDDFLGHGLDLPLPMQGSSRSRPATLNQTPLDWDGNERRIREMARPAARKDGVQRALPARALHQRLRLLKTPFLSPAVGAPRALEVLGVAGAGHARHDRVLWLAASRIRRACTTCARWPVDRKS